MSKSASASTNDFRVPARYYMRLMDVLASGGINPDDLLQPIGLNHAELSQTDASIRLQQVEALVESALQHWQKPGLAIDLGKVLKLTSHSIVGFGILSSPNVDYALRLVARYFGLVMPSFRMRYARDSKMAEIQYEPVLPMSPRCLHFHIEAIAVATHTEAKELLLGQMPNYDLYLSIPRPEHHQRYAEISEARCHFEGENFTGIRMVFPSTIGQQPLPMADASALKLAEDRCRDLLSKVVAKGRTAEWVEMMLREASGGMPTLEELARSLNLTPRTLNRHLQREDTGFRELFNKVLVEKSQKLLAEDRLSITQIAYELGYSDASNFTRAFRNAAGCSPKAFRERHAAITTE
ncbi:MAG: AraC family transcriptional regulator ligand-binding domain-containing protein [Salinisphaeraceae bacterium]|nr:AraC family transcriptional regulator ligand-binding domain-containing protein [Salinisphaeraceae bacterium]